MKKIFFWVLFLLFLPITAYSAQSMKIEVDFEKMSLTVSNENGDILNKFLVALPRVTPPFLPVRGKIKEVILESIWYPSEKTRAYYKHSKGQVLPEAVPFGHPLNAMGVGKIIIDFESKKINPLIRIHGTNDPGSIGERITRGCIRMKNEDFLKLVSLIKDKDTIVIFK
ncbi:MAG: L,D-transpeptidase [Candidatus Zambryskibacteria bacterium]|nr:L,D-transpeptidase [Candidatus Zambryskibacteria bacterium]